MAQLQRDVDDAAAADSSRGGSRERISWCSLLFYVALFMGVDPDDIYCPLAGTESYPYPLP